MPLTGTKVVREMEFQLTFTVQGVEGYDAPPEDSRQMNKIVAKDTLTVTSTKSYNGAVVLTESRILKKAFITGHDVARAIVECEKVLRGVSGADPDHCFFEGVFATRGAEEVICMRWGS